MSGRFRELTPRVRFTRKASGPGGIGVDQAVRAAEARIAPLKEKVAVQVLQLVDELLAAGAPGPEGRDIAALRRKADALVGLCSTAGHAEFQSVASSLCRLIDAGAEAAPVNPAALAVHLDALRLFRDSPPEMRARVAPSVLEGLSRLATLRARPPTAA